MAKKKVLSRKKMEALAKEWCTDGLPAPESTRDFQMFYCGYKLGELQARKKIMNAILSDHAIGYDNEFYEVK